DLARLAFSSIFNKTYFAFEEAGLAYPCLPLLSHLPIETRMAFDALIRVLADQYRYQGSEWSETQANWQVAADVKRGRVRRYADAAWGADANNRLDEFLKCINDRGHTYAFIRPGA